MEYWRGTCGTWGALEGVLGMHLGGTWGGKRRGTLRVTCGNSIASWSLLKTVIKHANGEVSCFAKFLKVWYFKHPNPKNPHKRQAISWRNVNCFIHKNSPLWACIQWCTALPGCMRGEDRIGRESLSTEVMPQVMSVRTWLELRGHS